VPQPPRSSTGQRWADIVKGFPLDKQQQAFAAARATRLDVHKVRAANPSALVAVYTPNWVRAPYSAVRQNLIDCFVQVSRIHAYQWVGVSTMECVIEASYLRAFSERLTHMGHPPMSKYDAAASRRPKASSADKPEQRSKLCTRLYAQLRRLEGDSLRQRLCAGLSKRHKMKMVEAEIDEPDEPDVDLSLIDPLLKELAANEKEGDDLEDTINSTSSRTSSLSAPVDGRSNLPFAGVQRRIVCTYVGINGDRCAFIRRSL